VLAKRETVALLLPEDRGESDELEPDDKDELVNVPGAMW
jgi:hypothetical protein